MSLDKCFHTWSLAVGDRGIIVAI